MWRGRGFTEWAVYDLDEPANFVATRFSMLDHLGRATVNGHGDLMALKIAPEVVDPKDPEMLEDLVLTAVNEALRRSRDRANEQMNQLTGGMGFPGL